MRCRQFAKRRFKQVIVLAAMILLIRFLWHFIPGIQKFNAPGTLDFWRRSFVLFSLIFVVAFIVGNVVLWRFGLGIILIISCLFHCILGRKVRLTAWQATTCRALWPWPWATGFGGCVLLVYTGFDFGGWPHDAIFGVLGHILGAWCYLTILLSWKKLSRLNYSIMTFLGALLLISGFVLVMGLPMIGLNMTDSFRKFSRNLGLLQFLLGLLLVALRMIQQKKEISKTHEPNNSAL